MKYRVRVFDKDYEVNVEEIDVNVFEVEVNGKRAILRLEEA